MQALNRGMPVTESGIIMGKISSSKIVLYIYKGMWRRDFVPTTFSFSFDLIYL